MGTAGRVALALAPSRAREGTSAWPRRCWTGASAESRGMALPGLAGRAVKAGADERWGGAPSAGSEERRGGRRPLAGTARTRATGSGGSRCREGRRRSALGGGGGGGGRSGGGGALYGQGVDC
ncbi:hypothetical protein PVAP13_1KG365100 [Panicum virgatum]|uniref:Uncharacterized protein n=1 Tax=Panicum virgatum TaxID=38727 RepID=A0A8T0XK40_PANVG|nr:hypothetical protein PVAP13_1KG365100 [Panicum virgatum]